MEVIVTLEGRSCIEIEAERLWAGEAAGDWQGGVYGIVGCFVMSRWCCAMAVKAFSVVY